MNAEVSKPSKPFLIQGKLPHLSGEVKILLDDKNLAFVMNKKKN